MSSYIDPVFIQVCKDLYIGNKQASKIREYFGKKKWAILNLCGSKNWFEEEDGFEYGNLDIDDDPNEKISQYFDEVMFKAERLLQIGYTLFIHCNRGKSRTYAFACAFLMRIKKMKLKKAINTINRKAYPFKLNMNNGFKKQIENYELETEGIEKNNYRFLGEKRNRKMNGFYEGLC